VQDNCLPYKNALFIEPNPRLEQNTPCPLLGLCSDECRLAYGAHCKTVQKQSIRRVNGRTRVNLVLTQDSKTKKPAKCRLLSIKIEISFVNQF